MIKSAYTTQERVLNRLYNYIQETCPLVGSFTADVDYDPPVTTIGGETCEKGVIVYNQYGECGVTAFAYYGGKRFLSEESRDRWVASVSENQWETILRKVQKHQEECDADLKAHPLIKLIEG